MSTSFEQDATILTINCGSSSLKATLFDRSSAQKRLDFRYGQIGTGGFADHASAIDQLLIDLKARSIDAIAHRMTHGGDIADQARLLDDGEIGRLHSLIDLAPLHLPHNLRAVALCAKLSPLQFGCYDTSFHARLPPLSRRLPLPESSGLYRCGFHGLNYAFIADQLPKLLGSKASGRIAIAHLGNGSSLCLLKDRCSHHTSMGWTPLGGVAMGTRSGDLDPGAVLHLLKQRSIDQVAKLLWQQSGLLALSDGCSSQMQNLIADTSESAQFAIEYYCRRIAQELGGMAACSNGLDALIFTGGIGENAPKIRKRICQMVAFLGFSLDVAQNEIAAPALHSPNSHPILLVKADEERYMQKLALNFLQKMRA